MITTMTALALVGTLQVTVTSPTITRLNTPTTSSTSAFSAQVVTVDKTTVSEEINAIQRDTKMLSKFELNIDTASFNVNQAFDVELADMKKADTMQKAAMSEESAQQSDE
jgi:uncharacterized membrane protein YhiD involved in acid resistance